MQFNIEQKVYVGLGLLFVLLLGVGVLADRTVAQLVDDSQWENHSVQVTKSVEELQSLMADAQAARNPGVSKRIEATVATIRNLTMDNDRQQGQLDVLAPMIAAELKSPLPSPERMTEIRKHIGLLRAEEERVLDIRHVESQAAADRTIVVVRVGALLGLVAVLFAAWI